MESEAVKAARDDAGHWCSEKQMGWLQDEILSSWVVVSNIFLCSSLFGEMIQFD